MERKTYIVDGEVVADAGADVWGPMTLFCFTGWGILIGGLVWLF